jgi:hypothetical protein
MEKSEKLYEKLKLDQLEIAHNCNALLFSRDRYSLTLPKKLKAEFAKFFVCGELKDLLRLLGKINNNTYEQNKNHNVDIVSLYSYILRTCNGYCFLFFFFLLNI